MKQISQKQMEAMALADKRGYEQALEWCIVDWLRKNAEYVAAIETGRSNKTLYGEWPKGWKAEMMREAKVAARAAVVSKFKLAHILELDGALWLRDWQMIDTLAKKPEAA
jgi:hypothetical protein